jgi:hypothetical protein
MTGHALEKPMPNKARILVMGATGQVGGGVVSELVKDARVEVVAAARDVDKAGRLGVPVVHLDLDKIETFAPALHGIDSIFMATGYTVDMLRQSKDLVNAAKRTGAKHIVHLGACADDDTRVAHYGWRQFIERYIEWSGIRFTHLRPEIFMQNLLGYGGESYVGRLRSVRMHVSMGSFGPTRSAGLEWTIDKTNFSHVLSIYGGHFMDMLFHIVGEPKALSSIVATQFPELTLSRTGQSFLNETPDCVMVIGALINGALFEVQIEGGKLHQSKLQIDITGTSGDLRITNTKSFGTKQDNLIEGSQGDSGEWRVLPTPERYHTIPDSSLDVSVQDLAQLYSAFAKDRASGTSHARSFSDAVAMHRVIDAINSASSLHHTVAMED